MTETLLNEILNIASQYNKNMNDYGILSPADLVIQKLPWLFTDSFNEDDLYKMADDASWDEYSNNEYDNISGRDGYRQGFIDGFKKAINNN